MRHVIIGTGGHVDHGKTELIKTLTGIDTDRLQEEKQRGISIDLGFAHFQLPSGTRAGIVDVPGHERFIKNMMAGASGMDIVMLVIAADEGVRPQTLEHLQILSLFQVRYAVVVMTKIDLVDCQRLEQCEQAVRSQLSGTAFAHSPLVKVSARNGEGLPQLIAILDQLAGEIVPKPCDALFRMPIDRVFSVPGFGTVVTGTVWNGTVTVNEKLYLHPQGIPLRVRGLEVFGEKVKCAAAGQRVALNLADIETEKISRGCVLATSGWLNQGTRLKLWFQQLDRNIIIRNNMQVRAYVGTAEIMGRLIVADQQWCADDPQGVLEIKLSKPVSALAGDRMIVRRHSPQTLLGGGIILHIADHRLKNLLLDQRNRAFRTADCGLMIQTALQEVQASLSADELRRQCGTLADQRFGRIIHLLIEHKQVVQISGTAPEYISFGVLQARWQALKQQLEEFHARYPYRSGIPLSQLTQLWFAVSDRERQLLLDYLQRQHLIRRDRDTVCLADHEVRCEAESKQIQIALERACQINLFQPPEWEHLCVQLKDRKLATEVLNHLLEQRILFKLGTVVFHRQAIEQALEQLTNHCATGQEFSVAEFRDWLQTSRKYTLLLLEYFDQQGWTLRRQDKRIVEITQISQNCRNIPPC